MHRFAPVALATLLAATAPALLCAQAPTPFTPLPATGHFTDPANLAGERVRPRDGRELPIDGGIGANGQPDNSLGLAQQLRRLNTRASLMLIVAHPDDEDGGMLTYYSRGLGARVAVLTLTRGEGGQNAMTGDFEDALGLLRTQELLSADRYMGVDQFFGTEVDFGFTKTKAEAFQKWNHERVLYDAVRAVRIFRPLVIAAVFSGAVTDGHGQHQVSGQIAQEVFKAAGDPNVFPELTKEGILPWQPLKVYARVPFSRVTAQGLYDYATGQTVPAEFTNYVTGQKFTTEPTPDVTINEGATDPLLTTCAANPSDLPRSFSLLSSRNAGSASPSTTAKDCTPLSYVQFARIGLGLQRSQIGGGMRVPSPGRADVSYHLYGSRVCAPNLPNPTPALCNREDNRPSSTLSSRPEASHREAAAERPAFLLVDAPNPNPSGHGSTKAPTARAITAQGDALGNESHNDPSAEGATYNPAPANQPSFFDGIDTSLTGIASEAPAASAQLHQSLQDIQIEISNATKRFDPRYPQGLIASLGTTQRHLYALLHSLQLASDAPLHATSLQEIAPWAEVPRPQLKAVVKELQTKWVQLNDALALAADARLDATLPSTTVIKGQAAAVNLRITVNATGCEATHTWLRNAADLPSSTREFLTQPEIPLTTQPLDSSVSLPDKYTRTITRPYFQRRNTEQAFYDLIDASLRNAPETPPAITAFASVHCLDAGIVVARVVHSGPQPVQIIPPVSLTLDRNAQVLPDGTHLLNIDVHTVSEDHPQGELRLHAPQDWTIRSPQRPLRAGTETFPASLPMHPQTATLKAEATISGTTYNEGFRPVGYGTLPRTNFYTPATLRVVPVDLKLPPPDKRRIAYLPGTGDDVPAALASIGLTPTILKVSDLTPANLSKYDTVILGVRTYNAHPDLHGAPTQALLDFARNGGNVVVQYQTPEFTAADAPYPLTDHNERVIDETAPVVLLTTANSKLKTDSQTRSAEALLTTPNRITPADFNNWIEERGHGFLDTWDPHYTALTETHDPGAPAEHIEPQAPQRGGLITVQLGRGRWTYCAFALYRQLPEAVPGAFRLFVNLLNP